MLLLGSGSLMVGIGVGVEIAVIVILLRGGRRCGCEGGGSVVNGQVTNRGIELCCQLRDSQ